VILATSEGITPTTVNHTVILAPTDVCNITISNSTTVLINNALMSTQNSLKNYSFMPNSTGIYPSMMVCVHGLVTNVKDLTFFANPEEVTDLIGFIIFLPLLFGFLIVLGTAFLEEEHKILKILSYGLSFPLFFASGHFATISVFRFYAFTELQNALGTLTYWVGIMFFIVLAYFGLYIIYSMINAAAQRKKAKNDY
jgi:hypothetical protein